MLKNSIKICFVFLVIGLVLQESKAAYCDNGVCFKDCGIGSPNSFGDYEIGWCFTKNPDNKISQCSTNQDCRDAFKCLTKCIY